MLKKDLNLSGKTIVYSDIGQRGCWWLDSTANSRFLLLYTPAFPGIAGHQHWR